jgi:flagellar motor protein MotB
MARGSSLVIVLEGFYTVVFSAIILAQNNSIAAREERVESAFKSYSDMKEKIYDDLSAEFSQDMGRWNATLDKNDLSIKFFMDESAPRVMFKPGNGRQTEYYDELIADFCPRYYRVIRPIVESSLVTAITVEGHTSSEWRSGASESESYYANLSLSQERAKNVMVTCLKSIEEVDPVKFVPFRKKITANGAAFSKVITDGSGQERAGASRRVEFKIVTSFDDNIEKVSK